MVTGVALSGFIRIAFNPVSIEITNLIFINLETEWCGWNGSVASFIATDDVEILGNLTRFLLERGAPQVLAWDSSIRSLKETFQRCLPEATDCELVLEYELPRSGGRRPDLIFLNNGVVLVIEFKNRVSPEAADIDQVLGYVRELEDYHEGCRGKTLIPVLVPIGFQENDRTERDVQIVSPKGLARIIREVSKRSRTSTPNSSAWVKARYEPLPALVEAAKLIFKREPLPQIRTAESSKIPEVVARIETIAAASIAHSKKSLVIVTGVPGAGKTLVGLQCAYSISSNIPSVFLSGNGPLVDVLQHQLGSDIFVVSLKKYLREFLVRRKEAPRQRLVVFDEAQRAWDRDRVVEKHPGELGDSEPALLLQIGELSKEGFTVVALMGEGQEIHAGEEAGIENWVDAVSHSGNWHVYGPKHHYAAFAAKGIAYSIEPQFHLTSSLRSHRALDVAKWTDTLLTGGITTCKQIAETLITNGYALKVSRDLQTLKEYVRDRYAKQTNKRIGIIASSKFRKLGDYGVEPVRQGYYYYGRWYGEGIGDLKSGSRLESAVSEFGCQGLELDMPLLCWGPDWRYNDGSWLGHMGKPRKVKDPQRLRLNAYRVLLTRGRDGLVVFVPQMVELDETFLVLQEAGMEKL